MKTNYAVVKLSELKKLSEKKVRLAAFVRSASSHVVESKVIYVKDAKGKMVKICDYFSEPRYKGFRILNPFSFEAKEIDRVVEKTDKANAWIDRPDLVAKFKKKHA